MRPGYRVEVTFPPDHQAMRVRPVRGVVSGEMPRTPFLYVCEDGNTDPLMDWCVPMSWCRLLDAPAKVPS